MAWTNPPLEVFHGTILPFASDIWRNGIDTRKCNKLSDFSRGFYVTTHRAQAITHANNKYRRMLALIAQPQASRGSTHPHCACVLTFTVDRLELAKLRHLVFTRPNNDWLSFVAHCRKGGDHIPAGTPSYYDVVFGPIQMFNGTAYPQDNDQLSFHSQAGTDLLSRADFKQGTPVL